MSSVPAWLKVRTSKDVNQNPSYLLLSKRNDNIATSTLKDIFGCCWLRFWVITSPDTTNRLVTAQFHSWWQAKCETLVPWICIALSLQFARQISFRPRGLEPHRSTLLQKETCNNKSWNKKHNIQPANQQTAQRASGSRSVTVRPVWPFV